MKLFIIISIFVGYSFSSLANDFSIRAYNENCFGELMSKDSLFEQNFKIFTFKVVEVRSPSAFLQKLVDGVNLLRSLKEKKQKKLQLRRIVNVLLQTSYAQHNSLIQQREKKLGFLEFAIEYAIEYADQNFDRKFTVTDYYDLAKRQSEKFPIYTFPAASIYKLQPVSYDSQSQQIDSSDFVLKQKLVYGLNTDKLRQIAADVSSVVYDHRVRNLDKPTVEDIGSIKNLDILQMAVVHAIDVYWDFTQTPLKASSQNVQSSYLYGPFFPLFKAMSEQPMSSLTSYFSDLLEDTLEGDLFIFNYWLNKDSDIRSDRVLISKIIHLVNTRPYYLQSVDENFIENNSKYVEILLQNLQYSHSETIRTRIDYILSTLLDTKLHHGSNFDEADAERIFKSTY
ncbi:MAG: hypothetical protein KDD40_02775 [Bdellovibrionales bacterium]|nr:hypothetical protein [Bdellovibrionales bacterium]